MAYYIEFPTDHDGVTVLVETDGDEVAPPAGIEKAGFLTKRKTAGDTVATARLSFDVALKRIVQENVRTLTEAIDKLANRPHEIELTFGLKATGEAGNIAIAKVGGEASFQLRLLWKPSDGAAASASEAKAASPDP
jgi:hypothetical protein